MRNTPAVAVLFHTWAGCSASIRVIGHNDARITITLIHETIVDVRRYEQSGDASSEPFIVQDGESLAILVRSAGEIIASGIFEVDVRLCEQICAILVPHAISNMVLDQCEEEIVERGCQKAMARVGL